MLSNKIVLAAVAALMALVGAVTYSWASWTTETLIAVDKRTEVIEAQLEFIKTEMERLYASR
jgi:hypothetical protein|tara:strand:- start:904 stop:1089 length:186 start_codon:yes stop_codon:yes gene_type:complete